MSNSILDFIGEIQIFQTTDWMKLTDNAMKLFVEKSHTKSDIGFDKGEAGKRHVFVHSS